MKKGVHREENFIVTIGIIIIGIILLFHIAIFNNYKKNLIHLQEDHMITTAKAAANNLQIFYDEHLKTFDLFFTSERSSAEMSGFFETQQEISSITVIDTKGNKVFHKGNKYDQWIDEIIKNHDKKDNKRAFLMAPVLTGDRHFTHFMVKYLEMRQDSYYVVVSMELPYIYEMLVKPISIGQYGYSMVKNMDGLILMHKSVNQIGIDAVKGRKEQYQEYQLDLSDLEQWIEEQRNHAAGSRILNSYWWDDQNSPVRSQKVVAYTQVPIGDETWILNCTLDYNEIEKPLQQAQQYVFLSSVVLLIGFGFLCFWVIDNRNKNQQIQMEMEHLREMNEAWEELHKREEQLRHRDKIQTLGTMASMISHEFNNFLTPILLYGGLLIGDQQLSKIQKEYINEILESAERAGELTKELSLYGRGGHSNHKKVIIHITKEIKRSIKMIEKTLPSNIKLDINLEEDSEYILLGGKGIINQIIINLSTNAIHAMKDNGGVLSIRGRLLKNKAQTYYGITVTDTGCGIDEDHLQQIFTPFYTTKEAGKGTGLGLSVVNDLIHQISGEINVLSKKGDGTRFDLIIPVAQKEIRQIINS